MYPYQHLSLQTEKKKGIVKKPQSSRIIQRQVVSTLNEQPDEIDYEEFTFDDKDLHDDDDDVDSEHDYEEMFEAESGVPDDIYENPDLQLIKSNDDAVKKPANEGGEWVSVDVCVCVLVSWWGVSEWLDGLMYVCIDHSVGYQNAAVIGFHGTLPPPLPPAGMMHTMVLYISWLSIDYDQDDEDEPEDLTSRKF